MPWLTKCSYWERWYMLKIVSNLKRITLVLLQHFFVYFGVFCLLVSPILYAYDITYILCVKDFILSIRVCLVWLSRRTSQRFMIVILLQTASDAMFTHRCWHILTWFFSITENIVGQTPKNKEWIYLTHGIINFDKRPFTWAHEQLIELCRTWVRLHFDC